MDVLTDREGKLFVAEGSIEHLRALGLDSFGAVMEFRGGRPVRDKGIRRISTLRLPSPEPMTLYLKQHFRGSLRDAVKDMLRGKRPLSAAAHEWRAIQALNGAGIATMGAVAYGERKRLPWAGSSFIITVGVEGKRLEDYVHLLRGKYPEKKYIIGAVAELARAMHSAGLNHRDLYLSHLFLREDERGSRLVLIDLQRVQHRARGFNRWVVKDLAALNYSSPAPLVTRTDRVRFLTRYLGVRGLDARGKRFAGRIARKTERIRRHDQKIKELAVLTVSPRAH